MHVSICVITYMRPEGLTRLLTGLDALQFKRISQPTVEVVLVDNDVNESARKIYEKFKGGFKYQLNYVVEPQRGISYARNRSVKEACSGTDFIAFIDDDEVPKADWLEELLIVQEEYSADVVHGRVIPDFSNDAPPWVRRGSFFEPGRHDTGSDVEAAYTNNSLTRAALICNKQNVFDERFALTGGEDSYFFRTLHHNGAKLVWADEAIVHESIPNSRTTAKWILMRAYRSCLTYTIWEKEVKASIATRLLAFVKAIVQILIGSLILPFVLFLGKSAIVNALLYIYKGAGRLSGLANIKYKEYKAIHGS